MPVTIGSNIASLKAQRQLDIASEKLSTTFQRLSSGQRINKASDDAAGLAIADTLSTKSRIYTQGIRNINDGISFANIAQGAIRSLSEIVLRQQELAEQAANGTYAGRQRVALNTEAYALTQEYNRIVQSTRFNGVQIIDGSDDSLRIQHGVGLTESTLANIAQDLGVAAGDGTFETPRSYAGGDAVTEVLNADLNGDGYQDIIATSRETQQISVFLGNGDGSFQARRSYTANVGATDHGPYALGLGDFNGDGKLDIAANIAYESKVAVLFGNGAGGFGSPLSISLTGTGFELETGDLNNDGFEDIVADSDSGINVIYSNGNGTFRSPIVYSDGFSHFTPAKPKDLNGDGYLDIVTASQNATYTQGQMTILFGKADGTFQSPTTFGSFNALTHAEVADINNDGVQDILATEYGPGTGTSIQVFIGNGNGTFQTKTPVTAAAGVYSLGVEDFNGDGYLDLASAAYDSNTVVIHRGNGDGTFSAAQTISTISQPYSFASADFNSDGVQDLAVASYDGDAIYTMQGVADNSGRRNNLVRAMDLISIPGAREALTRTTTLLNNINRELSNIGVIQRRLDHSSSTLAVRSENYEAARSRIVDVDVAEESANLARIQILKQTGAAVLAQANLAPKIALTLLRD